VATELTGPELATADDLAALAVTFSRAFSDDPMIRWPMPDATPLAIEALFRAILDPYVELGVAWKINACAGGAAWLPPAEARRFAEIEAATRPAIHRLTHDGGARYSAFWNWLDSHVPHEPCWVLDIVGVSPDSQRKGIGRALVSHGLDRARAAGETAFLETGNERNVRFYESMGFRIVEQKRAPDGGPMIWFMQTSLLPVWE
jgi:GNAT superfamily N-acetyltransferase